jgi:RNA polymerase sigma-70 factor, ECF subfamily
MTVLAKNSSKERDQELLLAVAGGSRRALEELYLSYHRRLARFLSRFTPRYENVEEIINDTFMVVWQSAKDFRYASQVSTWIIGIAYRRALKSLKSRGQRQYETVPIENAPLVAPDELGDAETAEWILLGMQQLPTEQRLALEFAYGHGHSCEEIAEIMECPVNTVKTRMFNARRKLRTILAESGTTGAGERP